jgi:hypothetical protein
VIWDPWDAKADARSPVVLDDAGLRDLSRDRADMKSPRLRKAMPEQQPGRLIEFPMGVSVGERVERAPDIDPEVGQIRLAVPDRGRSVPVLITEVHEGYVQGLLCGEDHALATETDAVLEPRQSGCPRPLLVHGDVSAAILKARLSHVLGATTPELVERIVLRGRGRDFGSRDLGRGAPVLERDDPRWDRKLEQLKRVRGVRARASELGISLHRLRPTEADRDGKGGGDGVGDSAA